MKIAMVVVFAAGCTSMSERAAPDAAPAQTVHTLVLGQCDPAWGPIAPASCDLGCAVMPYDPPCPGSEPCASQPPCAIARANPFRAPASCAATFVATDADGDHLGCCVMSGTSPLFYECADR